MPKGGMNIEGTRDFKKALFRFNIPLQGLPIEVGAYNMVGSAVSRGFPGLSTFHVCDRKKKKVNKVAKPAWCDACNRMVASDETVSGYEIAKNEFVFIDKITLDEMKESLASENLKVLGVTKLEHPIETQDARDTYLLAPPTPDSKAKKYKADVEKNIKFYALLADKLLKDNLYIIGKNFTVRGEMFVAIGAEKIDGNPMLVMYSLYYAEELNNPKSLGYHAPSLSAKEKQLMSKIVSKELGSVDYSKITSDLKKNFEVLVEQQKVGKIPEKGKKPATAVKLKPKDDATSELEKALGLAAVDTYGTSATDMMVGTGVIFVGIVAAVAIFAIAKKPKDSYSAGIPAMPGTKYFCVKCNRFHEKGSPLGIAHLKYATPGIMS